MVDKTPRPSREQIILEYLKCGVTYRQLEAKYGIDHAHIYRWVRRHQGKECDRSQQGKAKKSTITWFTPPAASPPTDPEKLTLTEQLQQAQLIIALLEEVIRIAQDEHGLTLPKKSTTKPAKLSARTSN